jgi:transposase
MDAYSPDLRFRILGACIEGTDTRKGVADTFGVSRSFVQKLLRCWEQRGELAPKPHSGGRPPMLDEAALGELRRLVQAQSDATLAGLCSALRDSGNATVSAPTVCRALQALDLPVKKSPCTPTSGTRLACGRCGGGGGTGPGRRKPPALFSWTKAGPTPP